MTRLLYISVLILCIFTSFMLYILSYDSKNIKREIAQIKTFIETEKSDIETLRAELSLLSQPDRIQHLSNQFDLELEPVNVTQIRGIEDIPLKQVAASSGFGDLQRMRRAFQRQLGVQISDYRNMFA